MFLFVPIWLTLVKVWVPTSVPFHFCIQCKLWDIWGLFNTYKIISLMLHLGTCLRNWTGNLDHDEIIFPSLPSILFYPFLCFPLSSLSLASYSSFLLSKWFCTLFIILYSFGLQVISNFTSAQSYFDFFSKEIDKRDLVSLSIIHNSFSMVDSFLPVMFPFSSRNWRRLK